MKRAGVILIDDNEIIFRVYETHNHQWKLYHYYSGTFSSPSKQTEVSDILEIIGEFFSTDYAQHIAEWKICSRHLPNTLIHDLSRALNLPIEIISLHREQELLCKGMFTELW